MLCSDSKCSEVDGRIVDGRIIIERSCTGVYLSMVYNSTTSQLACFGIEPPNGFLYCKYGCSKCVNDRKGVQVVLDVDEVMLALSLCETEL